MRQRTSRKLRPNDLGNLRKQDLPPKVGDAAFKLALNGVTSPIKTALGWHVVHVKKIEEGRTPTFDSLKAEITRDLAREMAVDNIVKLTGKLDDALAGGASLEDAASAVSAKVLKFAAVDSTGKGPDGKPVSGLPKSPLFLEKIATTPKDETTNVEETQKGGFFVLKVMGITPAYSQAPQRCPQPDRRCLETKPSARCHEKESRHPAKSSSKTASAFLPQEKQAVMK